MVVSVLGDNNAVDLERGLTSATRRDRLPAIAAAIRLKLEIGG